MGKLIVLEGTDGSGKATQTAALLERLQRENIDCRKIEFPRYQAESSALIREYLRGDFGQKPTDVNAFAASTFYAVDRYASYKQDWGKYYEQGGLVLADRYTTSNAVHQGSKLTGQSRLDFFDWLFDYEYRLMELPKPDLVIYLDVPVDLTERNMHRREAQTGTSADIHERDDGYLRQCRQAASEAAERFGWARIACTQDGVLRAIDDIHEDIYRTVKEVLG